MNRTVPTLLGIMILLMVGMLVVLIYDFRVTTGLASGGTVVGTVGGEMLTGVEQPSQQISPSEAAGRGQQAARISAAKMQQKHGKLKEIMGARSRAQQKREEMPKNAQERRDRAQSTGASAAKKAAAK